MWTVLTFVLGACAGGAGIGWLFWNKKKQLEETIARLGGRV